jgi:hypothetical protein
LKDSLISCVSAISLDISPSLTYNLTFSNCIFLGFDHALTSSHPSLHLTLSDCVFKQQYRDSLLLSATGISFLLIDKTTFKKGCE